MAVIRLSCASKCTDGLIYGCVPQNQTRQPLNEFLFLSFLKCSSKTKYIHSSAFLFPILPSSQCHSRTSCTQTFPSVYTMCVSMKTRSSVDVKVWKLDIWQLVKVTSSLKFGITVQLRSLQQHVRLQWPLTSKISVHHSVHAPSPSIHMYWILQMSLNSLLN